MFNVAGLNAAVVPSLLIHSFAYNFSSDVFRPELISIKKRKPKSTLPKSEVTASAQFWLPKTGGAAGESLKSMRISAAVTEFRWFR